MYKSLISGLVLGCTLVATNTQAKQDPFAEAEAAINYRQKVFSVIAANMGDIGAALKGKKEFDAEVIQRRADAVQALSLMPLDAFRVTGSDQGKTDAKSEVWQDFADFEEKMKALQTASSELAKVAQSGDKKQLSAAFKNTYKSCKGCHDSYKKD